MSGYLVKIIDAKIAQKFIRQWAELTADETVVLASPQAVGRAQGRGLIRAETD